MHDRARKGPSETWVHSITHFVDLRAPDVIYIYIYYIYTSRNPSISILGVNGQQSAVYPSEVKTNLSPRICFRIRFSDCE